MPNPVDAITAALSRLPEPERTSAFLALCARLDDDLPPHQRLAAWYRREKREAFMDRFRSLPIREMSGVYLRLVAGEDPAALSNELPTPTPRGAGLPEEGNNDNSTQVEEKLKDARGVLASLIEKRAEHEKRTAALGRERAELAYDAHRGDPKSRKRLDGIHIEASKLDSEGLSLDAAIRTAQSRVADADADVARAKEVEDARRALVLLAEFRSRGTELDAAARNLLDQYEAFRSTFRSLRTLNATPVSEALMISALRRALIAVLQNTDLRVEPFLAPNERRTFSWLVDQWSQSVETWCARRLPETQTQEEAA